MRARVSGLIWLAVVAWLACVMTRFEIDVGAALEGTRLDRAVSMIAGVSRSTASDLIAHNAVMLDGASVTTRSRRLVAGESLEIVSDPVVVTALPQPDPTVEFASVFEDDHVIVVDKPAQLVVHPGAGNREGTLVNGLLWRYPELAGVGDPHRPGIVHRLDRGTSGLLAVARSQQAYQAFLEQFATRRLERVYTALVWGHPEAPSGVIDAPIARSKRNRLMMTISAAGREARTLYSREQLLSEPRTAAVLTCRLESGRTHQIRVHLKAIGHPVAGDGLYGSSQDADAELSLTRPFLHARRLVFTHPVSHATVSLESPLADDLAEALKRCS